MKTFYSREHAQHCAQNENNRGRVVAAFERPERADLIAAAIEAARIGPIESPAAAPLSSILRIHDPSFVDFLQGAYREWLALGRHGDALPMAWAIRGMRTDRSPRSLDGRLGFYSFDVGTPLTAGSWTAAKSAADSALAAASHLTDGAHSAFALCRPPGHHAGADFFGGYCYLNNAAIAAQSLLDRGASRIAILDVDYHHGNGTQAIFYARSDVLYVSIHADPATDYPFFLGFADEAGCGQGCGYNVNLPLPAGTAWPAWSQALDLACRRIDEFGAGALVVSLGVDTFQGDPICSFQLASDDYVRMGSRIAALGRPTLFVMEGGYAVAEIGVNTSNVLHGFEAGVG